MPLRFLPIILVFAGLCLLSAAATMVFVPAGLGVAGAGLAVVGVFADLDPPRR